MCLLGEHLQNMYTVYRCWLDSAMHTCMLRVAVHVNLHVPYVSNNQIHYMYSLHSTLILYCHERTCPSELHVDMLHWIHKLCETYHWVSKSQQWVLVLVKFLIPNSYLITNINQNTNSLRQKWLEQWLIMSPVRQIQRNLGIRHAWPQKSACTYCTIVIS